MRIVEDAVFDTKFNHVKHEVELYLDGGNGESDNLIFPINPNSIVNLTIEDSLSDWPARGHMTFFYNPESGTGDMYRKLGQAIGLTTTNINLIEPKTFYNFRNDKGGLAS